MAEPRIDRHDAKVIILSLLIEQAQKWTFEWEEISVADRVVLKQVRDEYVTQLQGNLTFARNAKRR